MTKHQQNLLNEFLWELAKQIDEVSPGLPPGWRGSRAEDLADIFNPTHHD